MFINHSHEKINLFGSGYAGLGNANIGNKVSKAKTVNRNIAFFI